MVRHRVGFTGGLFWTGFGFRLVSFGFRLVFWFETGSDWFLGAQAPPRTNLNRFRTNQNQSETKQNQSETKPGPIETPRKANPMPYRTATQLFGRLFERVQATDNASSVNNSSTRNALADVDNDMARYGMRKNFKGESWQLAMALA